MGTVDDMQRDYRAAFLRYLPRHDEAALHSGYLIGRNAVANGVSMLELVCVHHDVLLEVLRDTPAVDLADVAGGASQFLVEVLATFDMAQRALLDDG
jgi:hypothetical protein